MNVQTPIATVYGDHILRFKDLWDQQIQLLKEKYGEKIAEVLQPHSYPTDVPVIFIKKDSIIDVLGFLKEDPAFSYNFLSDITATDEYPHEPRFVIVYNLFSHKNLNRIRIKVCLKDGEDHPTSEGIWPGANWAEREVWDMFGIKFSGHSDLRRILMDERWQGHPLRKDYALRGYQVFPTPEKIHKELLE